MIITLAVYKRRLKEKYKDNKFVLDSVKQRGNDPHGVHTEEVDADNLSNRLFNLDEDLSGMGGASIGTGISDSSSPLM